MSRRRWMLVVALLGAAGLGVAIWGARLRPVVIGDIGEVVSASVRRGAPGVHPAKCPAVPLTGTARQFGELREILDSAEPAEEHKCGDVARLILTLRDGRSLELQLLPGHNPRYYEFRAATGYRDTAIYRVPRDPFLASLGAIGLEGLPLGAGEG